MELIVVIAVFGFTGFALVSLVLNRIQRLHDTTSHRESLGPNGSGDDQRQRFRKKDTEADPQSPSSTAPPWYEVLGVCPTASAEEVKKAYRERIKEYHPDRVHGLARELRELAERRAQEINAAFAVSLQLRRH